MPDLIPVRQGIAYLPHQEAGIRWMLGREWAPAGGKDPLSLLEKRVHMIEGGCRGGILADDMGLGKTFQTIGLIKNSPFTYRTLILCPPALLSGWAQELVACGLTCSTQLSSLSTASVFLASYNKAHLHATAFRAARYERVILDEGHVIRNGESTKRWWSWMGITQKTSCRWILSATPVQNGIKDWRNLCSWLRVKGDVMTLAPVIMLRRTMDDLRSVMKDSLPPAPVFIRHGLSIPDGPESVLFRALTDQLDSVMESSHVSALMKLELYMRVQQFMVHPQIYIDSMRTKFRGAYPRPDWTGTTTKFSAVVEELRRSDEPTIIFCNFRAEMDRIADVATQMGRRVWSVRGGMGSEAVGDAVSQAREAVSLHNSVVVIVQIVAGGAGINLQFCTRILFLSQHWNPAVVHQAVGRAVRIGQRAPVSVQFFCIDDDVSDNIDLRMAQLHLLKINAACSICNSLFSGSFWVYTAARD
jgi:SNF2 family DNA or RNA helicase